LHSHRSTLLATQAYKPMIASTFLTTDVLIAYSAYFVGTASPGPSNLAIMSLAMSAGRKSALTFALGVVSGSFFWALLASLGLSAVLATYSECLVAIKIAGGLYLLWLGFKSARSAFSAEKLPTNTAREGEPLKRLYLRGLLLHRAGGARLHGDRRIRIQQLRGAVFNRVSTAHLHRDPSLAGWLARDHVRHCRDQAADFEKLAAPSGRARSAILSP
jgi:hypothetical protein